MLDTGADSFSSLGFVLRAISTLSLAFFPLFSSVAVAVVAGGGDGPVGLLSSGGEEEEAGSAHVVISVLVSVGGAFSDFVGSEDGDDGAGAIGASFFVSFSSAPFPSFSTSTLPVPPAFLSK